MGAKGSSSSGKSSSSSFVAPFQVPFLEDLFGQAQTAVAPAMEAVGGITSGLTDAFTNITGITDPTAQIEAQSASLREGLGQLFREEINPAIRTDAIAAGGFGGGRQGVAEGVATGQLADAYTQGYGDIVARANASATQAASLLPSLGFSATTAGFSPLAAYADILGNPIVLSEQRAREKSGSFGFSLF